MSAPEEGNGVAAPIPIPAVAVPRRSPTPRDADGRALPSGLPPASPAHGTPRSSRRAADAGRRSMDAGGRRSMEGGRRGQRHAVEVPEGAVPREGLVVSRQEKFGFIKCTTSEGRYFFHVNDCDGGAQYGSTVSFVVAHDLTTGKDVAYRVKTTATPAHSGAASPRNGSAVASRASTPDRSGGEGPAAAEGHASPSLGAGGGVAAAEALGGVPDAGAADVSPGQQGQGQQAGQHARQQQGAQQRRQAGPGPQAASGFEHFGHHRHPSPATQRDWRLPGREANALPPPQEPQQGRAHGGRRGSGSTPASGAVSDSSTGSAAAAAAPLPAPACYRGTVAQVARAGRQQGADDGLLLYIDEDGGQQRVRYGAGRLVEGCSRLEPGDAVEFELAAAPPGAVGGGYHHHPAAPHPHRAVALNVRLLSRGMAHSPSLEAVAAAAEAGDGGRGRQLGRVTLLKKEFGFIRQVERPGDMFFHFSQLEGWTSEEVKVGDDVEYIVRSDREGKLSAVSVRRAPPGLVAFESVAPQLLRGVVLERPVASKQYVGTSGVLEYDAAALPDGDAPPSPAPSPPGLAPGKARLPFVQQDVRQGSGSMRPGDHVTFRVATNLQAARAAALASVPGAAAYAGKRAVEVTLVRYGGTVVQVNRERQFGFIAYSEDCLLEAAGSAAASAAPSGKAAPAASSPAAADGAPPAAQAVSEGVAAVPVAPAVEEAAASEAAEGSTAGEAATDGRESGGAGAAAPPAPASEQPKKRLFFHFKEVSGQHVLKPGDEVAFVLHSNLKSGELNAQRVRRTKEGPELPPEPEPAPRPSPAPVVNPHRKLYSGNLSAGGYRQPKIAKMPDGTRGFDFPRPHAVLPPLPGLEKIPEPEAEEAAATEAGAAGGSAAAVPPAAVAAAAAAAAALHGVSPSVASSATSEGATPFSSLAAMAPLEAAAAEQGLKKLRLAAHLSAEAPAFVPRSLSSASLDKQSAEAGSK